MATHGTAIAYLAGEGFSKKSIRLMGSGNMHTGEPTSNLSSIKTYSPKKYIIAIDPGGTTGVAINTPRLPADGNYPYYTLTTKTPEELANLLLECEWDIIIVERFAAVTISHHGLYTVRLCGWIEAIVWMQGKTVTYHSPQKRYAFQKQASDYVHAQGKGHVIHEVEALAHLLAFEGSQDKGEAEEYEEALDNISTT